MNDRQIAFIMCVNDDRQADESEFYIRCLEVPEQYEVDVIRVHGGPGRPQQGIRQAQTDKSNVNDGQKKRDHRLEFLPQACYTCNASCALLLS